MAGALADVMKDQAQKAQSQKAAETQGKKRRKTHPITWGAFILFSAFSAYIWIASPEWLESGPDPLPAALVDAGLRMEVYQQALLINRFVDVSQRLPRGLEDLGGPETRVTYAPLGGLDYRLELTGPQGTVAYVSTEPLDQFLGNSRQIIRQGG